MWQTGKGNHGGLVQLNKFLDIDISDVVPD
jgi:hypothetical protein